MEIDGPAFIDFQIEQDLNVYPHVPAGESVTDMIEDPKIAAEEATA